MNLENHLPESSSLGNEMSRNLTHFITFMITLSIKLPFPFLKFLISERIWKTTEILPEKFNLLPKGQGLLKNTDTRNKQHTYRAEDTDIFNCKSWWLLRYQWVLFFWPGNLHSIYFLKYTLCTAETLLPTNILGNTDSCVNDTKCTLLSPGLKCLLLPLAGKISLHCLWYRAQSDSWEALQVPS